MCVCVKCLQCQKFTNLLSNEYQLSHKTYETKTNQKPHQHVLFFKITPVKTLKYNSVMRCVFNIQQNQNTWPLYGILKSLS